VNSVEDEEGANKNAFYLPTKIQKLLELPGLYQASIAFGTFVQLSGFIQQKY
jgi:hypothetical protein